jgi:uncharacterized phage-associated protein
MSRSKSRNRSIYIKIMAILIRDKKAVQALNFFATKEGGEINRMKAFKLIWLADRVHLRKFGRPILFDNYYAVKLGPIPSNAKDLSEDNERIVDDVKAYRDTYIRPKGEYKIKSLHSPENTVFSRTDLQVMESVYSSYGKLGEFQLSDLSHKFPEWKKFEEYFINGTRSKKMDFLDFFKDTPESEKYSTESAEILRLSEEVFKEGCRIC